MPATATPRPTITLDRDELLDTVQELVEEARFSRNAAAVGYTESARRLIRLIRPVLDQDH